MDQEDLGDVPEGKHALIKAISLEPPLVNSSHTTSDYPTYPPKKSPLPIHTQTPHVIAPCSHSPSTSSTPMALLPQISGYQETYGLIRVLKPSASMLGLGLEPRIGNTLLRGLNGRVGIISYPILYLPNVISRMVQQALYGVILRVSKSIKIPSRKGVLTRRSPRHQGYWRTSLPYHQRQMKRSRHPRLSKTPTQNLQLLHRGQLQQIHHLTSLPTTPLNHSPDPCIQAQGRVLKTPKDFSPS